MLGERSDQRGLWEADRLYLDHVGRDTFYGLMASLRGRLFRDADFAAFYCPDNGRDSVPPSLLWPVDVMRPGKPVRKGRPYGAASLFCGSLPLSRSKGNDNLCSDRGLLRAFTGTGQVGLYADRPAQKRPFIEQ